MGVEVEPEVHDYRSVNDAALDVMGIAAVVFVAILGGANLPTVTVSTGSGAGVRTVALGSLEVYTAFGIPLVLVAFLALFGLMRNLFESITIAGDEIVWRNRFGKVRRFKVTDVLGVDARDATFAFRTRWVATTRTGEIRFFPQINRRTILEQRFREMAGERTPQKFAGPRQWHGHTVYRFGPSLLIYAAIVLGNAAVMTWMVMPDLYRVAGHYRLFGWGAWLPVGVSVFVGLAMLARYFLESISIQDGEVIRRSCLGRVTARIPLDEIDCIDASFGVVPFRLYGRRGVIRLNQGVNYYNELIQNLYQVAATAKR